MITAVTSPDVVLELRPPPLASALYSVSLVVAVVLVVVVLTIDGSPLFTAVFVAFVVGITAYNTAAALSRARAHADGTTLPLVATETPPLPGQRRRLEGQAVELRRRLSDNAHR